MIDLDRLEERLDLALDDDVRRHLGLDRAAAWAPPAPAPVSSPQAPARPAASGVGDPAPPAPTRPAPARPVSARPPSTRPRATSPESGPPPLRIRQRRRTQPVLAGKQEATRATGREQLSETEIERHARRVVEMVSSGRIDDADGHIAAHAALADQLGDPLARRDAASWVTMRALLDGRHEDARAGSDRVLALGEEGRDPNAWSVHWSQRFWLLLDWGSDRERDDLLDLCRQRAYWHNELNWRGALALLLARLGYSEEAAREFDFLVPQCLNGFPQDDVWLDVMTNAGEAAAALGDARRAGVVYGALGRSAAKTAVVGRAWVCKGVTSRVLGLLAATIGRPAECDRHFGAAVDGHMAMGAQPLLARTWAEWGESLIGRRDVDAHAYLQDAAELARALEMVELAAQAQVAIESLSQPLAS